MIRILIAYRPQLLAVLLVALGACSDSEEPVATSAIAEPKAEIGGDVAAETSPLTATELAGTTGGDLGAGAAAAAAQATARAAENTETRR